MNSLKIAVKCDGNDNLEISGPVFQGKRHSWVEHLLDSVKVVSASTGRLRFKLGFQGDEFLADALRKQVIRLAAAKLASYSHRTQTALILFDAAQVDPLDVAQAVVRAVKEFARLHGECDLDNHAHSARSQHGHNHDHDHEHGEDCGHNHQLTDADVRKEIFKLAGTGAILAFIVYRRIKGVPQKFFGVPPFDLAALVTIASGYQIFRSGAKTLRKGKKPTDDTLISIAVIASVLMRESLTGLSVVWLIQLGRMLETITLKRSRAALKELMDVAPEDAWLISETDSVRDLPPVVKVDVNQLRKGKKIRVFRGEKVALDGKIIRGKALVVESFLTGESVPVEKGPGDIAFAGSVVESGEIDIEVNSEIGDTVVARMLEAIEHLRDRKAPIEKIGTRFASKFVPISIGLAGVTLVLTGDIRRAITMLVIACPCAAGLATPTAVSASIGQMAKKGVLIKGGTPLEAAAQVDTVVVDKTGTLTLGKPTLVEELLFDEKVSSPQLLRLAGAVEQYTTHPLGHVLWQIAFERNSVIDSVEDYEIHEGLGVSGKVGKKTVHVGSLRFMESLSAKGIKKWDPAVLKDNQGILFVAVNGKVAGGYVIEDTIRPEAAQMLRQLKAQGIRKVILATGDSTRVANHVASVLGIEEVVSEALPQQKYELVEQLQAQGRKVAMLGDGINDAQALAQSDVSIAIGSGRCDIAIETADVTIAKEDLLLIPEVLKVSQKTMRTIYQNFGAAVGINSGGIVLGAVGRLSPFAAAIVHNASTIAVVINSFLLGRDVSKERVLTSTV